jgi:crotonobetainyl-CoA:carnitine CoA-transferase CaiB-like acyl-CoA transferase
MRVANADTLDVIFADWIRERTAEEVLKCFRENDVAAGRVFDIRDIFCDPHYAARQDIVEVPDDDFGMVRMPGIFPRFARHDCVVRYAGGVLGRDNEYVLREILQLSEERLQELVAEQIV